MPCPYRLSRIPRSSADTLSFARTPAANPRADAVVIGGGPGGSTAATMMARQGLSVILVERENFPREHVGESLLPASIPVLEELGVLPAVQQAGFLPKYGATMVWGRQSEPWSWYFRETNRRYPHSYQVWRPQFDQLLLDNARARGVDVREGHQVTAVDFCDGESSQIQNSAGVHYRAADGREGVVRARFVVDASGSSALLSRQLGLRSWDPFFQNLAVYGYFTGGEALPSPDQSNIFIESYAQGWLWNIPLHTGQTGIGAVVDSQAGQKGMSGQGVERFFFEQIAQAPHSSNLLRDAQLVSGPFVVKDWSYSSQPVVGDNYILVGDAACFVDPLFSSGVHLALMSGVLAAAYVTSALKDAALGQAAKTVYQELYFREYSHFRELAKLFYSSNRTVDSYFWEARRLPGSEKDSSPRRAFIQSVAGQPPRGYERAVLERGQLPSDFMSEIGEIQGERARRSAEAKAALAGTGTAGPVLNQLVPILSQGVRVERMPVLGDGQFRWGYVLTTPDKPEGTECSPLVAALLFEMQEGAAKEGAPVEALLENLQRQFSSMAPEKLEKDLLATIGILYTDGAIDQLKDRESGFRS